MEWIGLSLMIAAYLVLLAWLWPPASHDPRPPWIERGKYWRRR